MTIKPFSLQERKKEERGGGRGGGHLEGERREEVRFNSWIQRQGSEVNLPHPASKEGLNSSSHSKAAKLIYTHTHTSSLSLYLSLLLSHTHKYKHENTHITSE